MHTLAFLRPTAALRRLGVRLAFVAVLAAALMPSLSRLVQPGGLAGRAAICQSSTSGSTQDGATDHADACAYRTLAHTTPVLPGEAQAIVAAVDFAPPAPLAPAPVRTGVPQARAPSARVATLLLAAASADALACSACGCTLNADWATQGLTSRTGLTADLRFDAFAEGDTGISGSRSSSLGDVRVLARYMGSSEDQDWGLQFGLKLPTGDSHGVDFDAGPQQGQMPDRGLQPGTGSTDLLLGAFKFGAIGATADWFGQALLQVPVASDRAFKPGIGANLTAGVRWHGLGAVVPQMQFNSRLEKRETGSDADTPNSGATLVYFGPGATFNVSEKASVCLFGQVPVYQRVDGMPLEPKWSLSAGVHAAF